MSLMLRKNDTLQDSEHDQHHLKFIILEKHEKEQSNHQKSMLYDTVKCTFCFR